MQLAARLAARSSLQPNLPGGCCICLEQSAAVSTGIAATASISQQTEDRAFCPVVQLFWLRASHCTDYHVTSLLFLRVTCPCSLRTYATLMFIRSSSSSSSSSYETRRRTLALVHPVSGLAVKWLDYRTFRLRFESHRGSFASNLLYAEVNSASYPQRDGKCVIAHRLRSEGLVWLTVAVVCLLAAARVQLHNKRQRMAA